MTYVTPLKPFTVAVRSGVAGAGWITGADVDGAGALVGAGALLTTTGTDALCLAGAAEVTAAVLDCGVVGSETVSPSGLLPELDEHAASRTSAAAAADEMRAALVKLGELADTQRLEVLQLKSRTATLDDLELQEFQRLTTNRVVT